jgi:hypothetical protein
MVEGGGGHDGGASREAAGLCLVSRPEEDEGGRGPAVRERRGRWAGGLRSGEWGGGLGYLGRWRAKAREVGGPTGLEKKRKRKSIQNRFLV